MGVFYSLTWTKQNKQSNKPATIKTVCAVRVLILFEIKSKSKFLFNMIMTDWFYSFYCLTAPFLLSICPRLFNMFTPQNSRCARSHSFMFFWILKQQCMHANIITIYNKNSENSTYSFPYFQFTQLATWT